MHHLSMNQDVPKIYSDIVARLAAVRRKQNLAAIMRGVLLFGFVFVGALLVALLIEDIFYLDVLPRTIIFYFLLSFATALFLWYIARPVLRLLNVLPNESDTTTATKVGRKLLHINDHLVNILQLLPERDGVPLYSVELIDASFEDARKEIEPFDFTSVVDFAGSRRAGKLLGIVAVVAVLVFVVFPTAFFGSATRLLHFSESFAAPLPFTFIVEPGDKEIVKGETVPIVVRVEGAPQKRVTFSSKPEGQIEYEHRTLEATPEGAFKLELPSVKSTTDYFVHAGHVQSKEYKLTVIDRPIVKMLRVNLAFPAYANLPPRQLDDNVGDVTALKGTRVTVSLEVSKEIAEARLVFHDGSDTNLEVTGTKGTGSLVLMKDRTYHLILKDRDGITNAEPIEYSMKIVADAYPTASILLPGMNLDIAGNDKLNMLYKINDDYGFSGLRLAYKLVQSRYERPATEFTYIPIAIPEAIKTEGTIAYLWSLDRMSLVPEDIISYYVEVFDNDNISGPKSALSEVYTLRLPSLDEVFSDLDKGHDVSLESMKEALQNAQEAKKNLDELQQQAKKNQQKLDWQEQKKAESVLKKYEDIQKKIDDVNKTVDKMVNEMQKNQVLSKETMEKYQELQQMMEQMNSPEFAEAMKKMQEALQQLNPEALRQALQQFQFSEEQFRQSIERTMNLLKRIQIEQKVDEVVKRAEELKKQQEELQKATEQTNPQDKDKASDLAQQQQDLKQQLDQLQKELEDLQKKMEEFPKEMPLSEMEKAQNTLQQSGLQQQMEQIAQQMQQGQMQQAGQNQQQAEQKMQDLAQQLEQMKQALQQNQQREIVNEMRKALQDLLDLSKRQESLKNESQSLQQNSPGFRENAQQQMDLMRDLEKVAGNISKLSQKTFGITPEMGKAIGDALREMNDALQSLEQRNGHSATPQQSDAMGSLNEAAQQVQGSLASLMQGNSGGLGMAGLIGQLQRMTGMQQGINQGTENLGPLSAQQAAEMARLAGEQGMVRKSLEQLAREATNTGELSKLLGDLNQIAQEMREVQTDLAQGNVNPETLRKQDRILSRLLDSQRSARERDYEKRRKAESGKDVVRTSPQQIDLTTQEGRNRLHQDLLKAIEEGYAKDYEELIRKYFEALERNEKQN
jgi:hypothetical protein